MACCVFKKCVHNTRNSKKADGVTYHKNKNDRINIIRKQYDAFLEEDKKRRERNEYILGKLDKMRSSAALVPISNVKYHPELDPSEAYVRRNNQVKTSTLYDNYVTYSERPKLSVDILNKHIDESTVLKEISKKYILIPKRISLFENECINRKDAVEDQDWTSKYNILDDLKRQEKEGHLDKIQQSPDTAICNLRSESDKHKQINELLKEEKGNKNTKFEIPDNNSTNIELNNIPLQTSNLSSNRDFRVDQRVEAHTDGNNFKITPEYVQSYQEHVTEKEKYNSDINEKNEHYLQENIKDHLQVNEGDIKAQSDYQDNDYQSNHKSISETRANGVQQNISNASIDNFGKITPEFQKIGLTESAFSKENLNQYENYENKKDIPDMHNLTPNEEVKSYDSIADNPKNLTEAKQCFEETSQNYEVPQESASIASNERAEICNNIGNTVEGQNTQPIESSYETTLEYDTTQNNNPVLNENTEPLEIVNHDSEINAFETEQKEMFYSEQPGDDSHAYSQEDGNTEQYTADGFEQNNQYAYYEGVQQEQAYATNINEHEEATEQYDPHYNQQYEGSYENQQLEHTVNYENAGAYEQQQYQGGTYENPQYDNVINYENQQDNAAFYQQDGVNNDNELQENVIQETELYDQQLYAEQPVTQEHIEEQLVAEEGYVPNSQGDADEFNGVGILESEAIVNNTTPAAQIPDPQVA